MCTVATAVRAEAGSSREGERAEKAGIVLTLLFMLFMQFARSTLNRIPKTRHTDCVGLCLFMLFMQ